MKYVKPLGYTEAVSLLLLVGFAMPMKYIWGHPEFVRYIGAIHGALFVMYVIALFTYRRALSFSWAQLAGAVVLSSVPFGPFITFGGVNAHGRG